MLIIAIIKKLNNKNNGIHWNTCNYYNKGYIELMK